MGSNKCRGWNPIPGPWPKGSARDNGGRVRFLCWSYKKTETLLWPWTPGSNTFWPPISVQHNQANPGIPSKPGSSSSWWYYVPADVRYPMDFLSESGTGVSHSWRWPEARYSYSRLHPATGWWHPSCRSASPSPINSGRHRAWWCRKTEVSDSLFSS